MMQQAEVIVNNHLQDVNMEIDKEAAVPQPHMAETCDKNKEDMESEKEPEDAHQAQSYANPGPTEQHSFQLENFIQLLRQFQDVSNLEGK